LTPSLTQDGRPQTELYLADGLHLNGAGYEVWASVVKPVLDKYDPQSERN
jgi:lysophospholipase L1-like esterase